MAESLYIIDGHAQIYRAYYAPFRDLTSPSGEPTRATYVFCQMLFNLLRDRKPTYVAMTLDVSDKTVFRCDIFPEYKANRDPAPEDLHVQTDRIVSIVKALGIPIFRKPGFEADDLMATIVDRQEQDDLDIYIVSRDKDLEQLITDRVYLYDATKSTVLNPSSLLETKGYTPDQVVEIQTLAGDSTDNIPGVKGVGVKTAAKLINKYGSAQAVLDHAEDLTPKQSENVKAFADQISITRQLVTLRRDVPFDFDLADCRTGDYDVEPVLSLFDELGFHRLKDTLVDLAGDEKTPVVATPSASDPVGKYHLIDSAEKLSMLAKDLAGVSQFAFDTETTSLNPITAKLVGLSFSWKAGEGYYVPVQAAMGNVVSKEDVANILQPVFENHSIIKIGHNLKSDLLVLRQVGIETRGALFDTMVASFLLEPDQRSHSLDGLAQIHFGHQMIPISDLIGKGKNQLTMDQLDSAQVCEYASEDADYTWRLWELLEPRIRDSHVASLFYDIEMPLVEVLTKMQHEGTAIDTKLLSDLGESLATRLAELEGKVHGQAGRPFNIDSPKQLAVVLFDELNLPVIKKTKTSRSTDAETLQALKEQTESPIPNLVLEYRELTKLKGTYVDTLPKMVAAHTNRIHATFHQTGAITGRLSSSNPNLQNIPIRTETGRLIRRAFIAGKPAHLLLSADYSQVELRLLAHFCEDETLVDAFAKKQDIHKTVAAQVNGISIEDVTSAQRSAAKAVNFGIIYGQSAFGLSRTIGVPIGEAKAFIDTYFLRYPGIRWFIDECIAKAKQSSYAETILGRRRPITDLRSRNRNQVSMAERIAVNTVVQGSAADLIKRAMVNIHDRIAADNLNAMMLIQVHDELVFEVPEDSVAEVAEVVRHEMEHALDLRVPLVVDIAWGKNWAETK